MKNGRDRIGCNRMHFPSGRTHVDRLAVLCSGLLLATLLLDLQHDGIIVVCAFLLSPLSTKCRSTSRIVLHDSNHDPPSSSSERHNVWTVLANTEQWISQTLESANQSPSPTTSTNSGSASSSTNTAGNPYSRKEVSYLCETATESTMIVANVFRRLKEARELGQHHSANEVQRQQSWMIDHPRQDFQPRTFRQTQVMVIPNNAAFSQQFALFDQLVTKINQARRNARDYVTDAALERLEEELDEEEDEEEEDDLRRPKIKLSDWSVAVNCAHLHPRFGERTPEQILHEMQQEDAAGGQIEIDLHYQAYQERRMKARRSPYPTLVLEVRATPAPDFGSGSGTGTGTSGGGGTSMSRVSVDQRPAGQDRILARDIQKLEALFGKSAHLQHPKRSSDIKNRDDDFYNAIGQTTHLQELSSSMLTPLQRSQQWVSQHDVEALQDCPTGVAFTESLATEMDDAYAFLFTNVAMMQAQKTAMQYVVLPRLLSAAATSFEKMTQQVRELLSILPDIPIDRITIRTFHPEHVDRTMRSPVPILCLQWNHEEKMN